MASVTREVGTEEYGHEAATPEPQSVTASGLIEGVSRTTEAFIGLFFFFYCTVEGGGGAKEDSIFASEDVIEANG